MRRLSRALLADLDRWEAGSIGIDDLATRHPDHAEVLTEMHALVTMLTVAPERAPGPSWKELSAMLPAQCSASATERRGLPRSLAVKSVVAAFLAGAVAAPATAAAQRGNDAAAGAPAPGGASRDPAAVVVESADPTPARAEQTVVIDDVALAAAPEAIDEVSAPETPSESRDAPEEVAPAPATSPVSGPATEPASPPAAAPEDAQATPDPTADDPEPDPEPDPAPEPSPAPDSGTASAPESDGRGRSGDAPGHGGTPPGQAGRPDRANGKK
ncbi:MAG: hypothetical protein HYU28_10600 [Actinobacteria bacterium]|nr:hypothetical protein [Actinomycetota bacterium]